MLDARDMTLTFRAAFLIILSLLVVWFLFLAREILTPFILAAIFAYLLNPVVSFFYHRIKLPKTISIIIIYLFLTSAIVVLSLLLTRRIVSEASELGDYISNFLTTTKAQLDTLPGWIRPTAEETLSSLEKSKLFSPVSLFTIFPQAISRIISLFIFLFSAFYFLKEGSKMVDRLLNFIPHNYRIEVEILLRKINSAWSGYLRGQLFILFIVSLMLFIALSILGVRFALILAIFSGLAEIVPIIGPIVAGVVAALVVLITGTNNFSLNPLTAALIVGLIYFLQRQFQDYFINPHIFGKIMKLHPLIIFFSVLAGGHLFGILGFVLAIPVVATFRILLEYSLDKLAQKW